MNISSKDLNMLFIFKVVMEELNASRAAERLSISQPTLSHCLNKLRRDFGDPLFVRNSRGLTPTPKAVRLEGSIRHIVGQIEGIYVEESDDEETLAHQHRTVKIFTTDYMQAILIPKLLDRISEKAPKLSLVVRDPRGELPKKELETGECDIAIAGYFSELPGSYFQQKIMSEKFVCLVDKQNKQVQKELSMENYLNCPHIITTLSGDLNSVVDKQLKKKKLKRKIIAGVPSFLATTDILQGSQYILTCLKSLGERAVRHHPFFRMFDCPVELPEVNIYQVWHGRTHEDRVLKWIRKSIFEILSNWK